MFNDKKKFIKKVLFCVITNTLILQILTNNLATFKMSNGVNDEKF